MNYWLEQFGAMTPLGSVVLAYLLCGIILWGFGAYLLIQLKRSRA